MRTTETPPTLLTGWGRTPVSAGYLERPGTVGDLPAAGTPRGAIARGLGRSYGDAAQNAGGIVYEMTRFGSFTLNTGLVTAEAGVTLGAILQAAIPAGWFLPVTPGTKRVTVGGALAADIHGKNHHSDGAFSNHVESFTLYTGDGTLSTVVPGSDAFRATAGGMGLTGVIIDVTFRLLPIETSRVVVDTTRTRDLDELMACMVESDDQYRYSVAWIDVLARGRSLGRGVLTRGDHAPASVVPSTRDPLGYRVGRGVGVPDAVPSGVVGPTAARVFNEAWYRKMPEHRFGELQGIDRFFYPLDALRHWNRLYGRRGFVQYQIAVPDGEEGAIIWIVESLAERRYASCLTVLKRLGSGNGLLSFPIAGWTLAVDLPVGLPGLAGLLDRFDCRVADAGGRVYLAKDGRARARVVAGMYPELDCWRAIRDHLDPRRVWRSDLARRLDLT